MRIKTTICVLTVFLLLPSLAAATAPAVPGERPWGLGWDEGLTLRRWLGSWELGLAAGPNDWLSESDSRQWYTEEPDSLQGRPTEHGSDRRESGFVRLQVGRRVAGQGPVHLMAHTSLQYRWEDERWENDYYYTDYVRFSTTNEWTETWRLALAIRLSWRPLDALSIETSFALEYDWRDTERLYETIHRDLEQPIGPDEIRTEQTQRSSRSFNDEGWWGLNYLSFIYWF